MQNRFFEVAYNFRFDFEYWRVLGGRSDILSSILCRRESVQGWELLGT